MSNFARMADGDKDGAKKKIAGGAIAKRTHGITNRPQQVTWGWREAPVPVIAAAHGVALGGGFQLYLGADIRYAAPKTRMSIMEIRWGLVPDMAATHMMTRLAGEDVVKELALTGRIFEAEEGKELGFITQIHDDPLAAALETAHAVANRNPDATRRIKRLFNEAADRDIAQTLMLESELMDAVIGHPNQIEAVKAEMEKRTPDFAPATPDDTPALKRAG